MPTAPANLARTITHKAPTASTDVTGQPDWVVRAVLSAADFWHEHGVDFMPAESGEVRVELREITVMGQYDDASGAIWISSELENTPRADCVIAHELGHAIGMEHISKAGDLMSKYASLGADGNCIWSNADQAEFDRPK